MHIRRILLLLPLTLAACERAQRYPAPDALAPVARVKATQEQSADWSWLPAHGTAQEMPIEFIAPANPLWPTLPEFWNQKIPVAGGMRTIHIGLQPLAAVSVLAAASQLEGLSVKVPRGLPDPNPLIPSANPPTFEKWRLGKKLFFAAVLRSGIESYSCASCHQPEHGFTDKRLTAPHGIVNTPSLINAVYNRHQFWDGRAGTLEEVVVRSLPDAPEAIGAARAEVTHVWREMVVEVARNQEYLAAFDAVFGIPIPTQDAIAKALATYMRTILSGDSLYDRAEAQRRRTGAKELDSAHFLAALDDAALKTLGEGKLKKDEAAQRLAQGHRLFHGKAKCAACHRGELFTDFDFHNIGLNTKDSLPSLDKPTGRFAVVPIGLKETRLIGAYKTPTLRALPRTARYFHDGRRISLGEVVEFYDHAILSTPDLAADLRNGDRPQDLGLKSDEIDALVLFLEALDGTPVDAVIAAPVRGLK
jgi:cytochrome c peroxidase